MNLVETVKTTYHLTSIAIEEVTDALDSGIGINQFDKGIDCDNLKREYYEKFKDLNPISGYAVAYPMVLFYYISNPTKFLRVCKDIITGE